MTETHDTDRTWNPTIKTADGEPLEPSDCAEWRTTLDDEGLIEDLDDEYVLVAGRFKYNSQTYHRPDEEDPDRPGCVYGSLDRGWQRRGPGQLWDSYSLCEYCSGETSMSTIRHGDTDDEPGDAP